MANELLQWLVALTGRPADEVDIWADPLAITMLTFDITTPARIAAFLASVLHESADLRRLEENLDYTAPRLVAVWPRHFHLAEDDPELGLLDATRYAHHPELLANVVYAHRMGNGDEPSGDGWRFRGRGLLQITGRELYQAFFDELRGLLLRVIEATGLAVYQAVYDALGESPVLWPDLLMEPDLAALSAGWYWERIDGNSIIRNGDDTAFENLTRAINGQLIGLEARSALFEHAKQLVGYES